MSETSPFAAVPGVVGVVGSPATPAPVTVAPVVHTTQGATLSLPAWLSTVYAMVVHVVSIVALVVLMATSHLDTTIGLPLLTGLLGLGTGVGLNVAPTTTPVVVAPTNPVV